MTGASWPGFRYSPPIAHSMSGSNRPLNPCLSGRQAWPMPVRSFTLVTIANEKSWRALVSDEITLTALGETAATLLRLFPVFGV